MPYDVQCIICEMMLWAWGGMFTVLAVILIGRRMWQMRTAELAMKRMRRSTRGSRYGY